MSTIEHPIGMAGPYNLYGEIGHGGFATVYLGQALRTQKLVAIKLMKGSLLQSKIAQSRHEAWIHAKMQHPNIVPFLDFGHEQGRPYIVMEYAPHGTLARTQVPGFLLQMPAILTYARQIATALQHVHQHSFVHCDLKPGNLLIGAHGQILLNDFGIAYQPVIDPDRKECIGTRHYMAPEQMMGNPSYASDQYALAIIIYHWLTGTYPFIGDGNEDIQGILYQQLQSLPPSVCLYRPELPQAINNIIFQALHSDPQQRYASSEDFINELAWAHQVSTQTCRNTRKQHHKHVYDTPMPQETTCAPILQAVLSKGPSSI